jgi:rhodanese-related sulfurtransferase
MLKELGHREVYNLAGGFDAWERAGLPFEKP